MLLVRVPAVYRRQSRRGPVVAALIITMVATGCATTDDSASAGRSATSTGRSSSAIRAGYRPRWASTPCPIPVPDGARVTCGTLTVPENRGRPADGDVVLPVVRIHSPSPTPSADPVVFLHGGPGIGTLQYGITTKAKNPALAHRDLILFDQRGTGLASPSLECPERESAFIDALSAPAPFARELAAFDTAILACHDRLAASGVDLDQYNSETDAADLADLRVALGIDRWNLWGVSYGTRLALTTMRSFPEGIRSVVLDSVYPPSGGAAQDAVRSGKRAFDALANGCGTDPVCHARYPDVAGDVAKLGAALDAEPFAFDYTDTRGSVHHLRLTGDDAVGGLFNALYDSALIPRLPSVIHDLANGGRSILPLIAQDGVPFVNDTTEGAFLSYECADNGARLDRRKVAELRRSPGRAGLLLLVGWNVFCDRWPVRSLARSYGDVVVSTIPTLVIAGEYDPITPPADSEAVARALEHSAFVLIPHAGHHPGLETECAAGIFTRFLDEGVGVDRSCVDAIVPARFA